MAAADPELWRWSISHPRDRESFHRYLDEALGEAAAGRQFVFTIRRRADDRVIGSTRMELHPEHRRLEIGWTWIDSSTWRTGANVEAKYLLLEHAFERMGCVRVELKTDSSNQRSRRAIEGIGGRLEGVFRKHMIVRSGERRDTAWYAILDDEWPDAKARLRQRLGQTRP